MVEMPPEFERRGDLVYITDPCSGKRRVMRRETFYIFFHNAAKCLQECHAPARSAEIIPVDFTSKFERVYPKDKSA